MQRSRKSHWDIPEDTRQAREYRENMVDRQLAARGLTDQRVLDAFRRVPRHLFCPPDTPLSAAYGDHPLSIGEGQTISQPYMVAEMTAFLELDPEDTVLEIGTGSAYQTAILAELAAEVHTVERLPRLAERARSFLEPFDLEHVSFHVADGTAGWPDAAPYDGIIVTAAAPQIPQPLKDQLADGGKLVIPVGPRHVQDLVICRRSGDEYTTRNAGGCRFVPLVGEYGWPD